MLIQWCTGRLWLGGWAWSSVVQRGRPCRGKEWDLHKSSGKESPLDSQGIYIYIILYIYSTWMRIFDMEKSSNFQVSEPWPLPSLSLSPRPRWSPRSAAAEAPQWCAPAPVMGKTLKMWSHGENHGKTMGKTMENQWEHLEMVHVTMSMLSWAKGLPRRW